MTAFLGIDVGLTGGLGLIAPPPYPWEKKSRLQVWPMPTVRIESKRKGGRAQNDIDGFALREILLQIKKRELDLFVLVELATLRAAVIRGFKAPNSCKTCGIAVGQGAASGAKFYGQYKEIRGILTGLDVPFTTVHPATWKADVFRGHGGDDKNASRMLARSMFPELKTVFDLKKNEGLAEAILLADYGRRRRSNEKDSEEKAQHSGTA